MFSVFVIVPLLSGHPFYNEQVALVVFYYISGSEMWPYKRVAFDERDLLTGLLIEVVSLEGDNLAVFYYISKSEK